MPKPPSLRMIEITLLGIYIFKIVKIDNCFIYLNLSIFKIVNILVFIYK